MKRIITLVLALILALTLCACVTPKTPMPIEDGDKSAAQPVTVRLGGLKGPTSMGMVKLFDDADNGLGQNAYTYTIAASANELTPQLVQGELDVLAVPANVAAILYNQTEGGVVLLAAGTLGVLYIVEKGGETVTDIASLNGKTIYATGKGATPEYALTYLLSQHGLTLGEDVQVEWKSEPTAQEAACQTDRASTTAPARCQVFIFLSAGVLMRPSSRSRHRAWRRPRPPSSGRTVFADSRPRRPSYPRR